ALAALLGLPAVPVAVEPDELLIFALASANWPPLIALPLFCAPPPAVPAVPVVDAPEPPCRQPVSVTSCLAREGCCAVLLGACGVLGVLVGDCGVCALIPTESAAANSVP